MYPEYINNNKKKDGSATLTRPAGETQFWNLSLAKFKELGVGLARYGLFTDLL